MGRVYALSISERKGTKKKPVDEVELKEDWGIQGDAHSGKWHRQVSLLAWESIRKMRGNGLEVGPGDFAENITTEDLDLTAVKVGDRILIGEGVILQVTQIGKECHNLCEIRKLTGKCIMPKEGIFTRCLRGGIVKRGNPIKTIGGCITDVMKKGHLTGGE